MTLRTDARELVLTEPDQLKAIAHPVRTQILQVLGDRPASAMRLAEWLSMSHGKVGHHLKVLERAGLVEVIEERKVRALTERLYGPTFERLRVELDDPGSADPLTFLFEQAAREAAPDPEQPFRSSRRLYAVRMPAERAEQFGERLAELADEFAAAAHDGPMFGFAGAVYLAEMPEE